MKKLTESQKLYMYGKGYKKLNESEIYNSLKEQFISELSSKNFKTIEIDVDDIHNDTHIDILVSIINGLNANFIEINVNKDNSFNSRMNIIDKEIKYIKRLIRKYQKLAKEDVSFIISDIYETSYYLIHNSEDMNQPIFEICIYDSEF